jgi:uncharacterized membrane protein
VLLTPPGPGAALPQPERTPVTALLMVALLAAGLLTFGLLFVLLALVLAGPGLAVATAVAHTLGSVWFLARLAGSLGDRSGR